MPDAAPPIDGNHRVRLAVVTVVRRTRTLLPAIVVATLLAACSDGGASPTSTRQPPRHSSSAVPAPSAEALAPADLKYRLADALGPLWFCDPDQHPVARDDEDALAAEHFDEIRRDHDTFTAIVEHLGLAGSPDSSDDKVAIYRDWKMLNAMTLDPASSDTFAFDYLAQPSEGEDSGMRSTGTISVSGEIDIDRTEDAPAPACPICLARGTMIDTPRGPVAVEDLSLGEQVWSIDGAGQRVSVPILRIGSMAAPERHRVIRLRLDDGREVTASPSHPLADGRHMSEVRVGDTVDGATAASVRLLRYGGGRTYDLLPGGPTGVYWAGGVPMASTLVRHASPLRDLHCR